MQRQRYEPIAATSTLPSLPDTPSRFLLSRTALVAAAATLLAFCALLAFHIPSSSTAKPTSVFSAKTLPARPPTPKIVPGPEKEEERCILKPDTGLCKANFTRYFYAPSSQSCKSFTWGGCAGTVPFTSLAACQAACVPRVSPAASPTPSARMDFAGRRFFLLNKYANDSRLCINSGSKALSSVTGTVWPDQVWRFERHAGYKGGYLIVNDYFDKYRVALSSFTKRLFAFNGRIWPDQLWMLTEEDKGWYVIENMFFKGYKIARVGRGPSGMIAYRGDEIEDTALWWLEEVA